MIRVLSIGECMIELTHRDADTLSLSCAGDTFNTAAYLARLTDADEVRVDYLTLLGDDHYSERLLAAMDAEGIGTRLIKKLPDGHPGLYLVRTDAVGERTFTYFRAHSPARQLFDGEDPALERQIVEDYDVVYLSAITLQILTARARKRLFRILREMRDRGAMVIFDSNYRPSGWRSAADAGEAVAMAWDLTSIALPTFADEQALFADLLPADTVSRLRGKGVPDIVVKDGARGCLAFAGEDVRLIRPEPVESVLDSTAAGDAFNAAYVAERLRGADQAAAVDRAHRLAATVIQHPGAIVGEQVLARRSGTRTQP